MGLANEMALLAKVLAKKPGDLSQIPRPHMEEDKENQLPTVPTPPLPLDTRSKMRLSVSDVKEGNKSLVQKCTNYFPLFRVRSGTQGEQGGKQRQAQAWVRPPGPGLEEAEDQAGLCYVNDSKNKGMPW